MTIKKFTIEYDAINKNNTFTNGDEIRGRIIVEASKETRIQSLLFIAKGNAHVQWHEYYGQYNHRVYWADEKYYEVKHPILREARQDGTEVIGQGRHVYPFTFKIPDRRIPSSFGESTGKIVHKLKAELKQSMKITKKAKAHFTFISKEDMDLPGLMEPQYGCKDKTIKVFGSGSISLDVHTNKMGYQPGETIHVTAEITNNSSRPVKPKFILYEKKSFLAQGHRKLFTNGILKEKVEAVDPCSGKKAVTKAITIPRELPPSILNCGIIKLEYRLKINLDVKYTRNPEIKLPIIIRPDFSNGKQLPAADFGFEASGGAFHSSWNNMPQQAAGQPMDPPPPYGAYSMYPSHSQKKF